MFDRLVKSIAQLSDRKTRGVLWLSIGLALLLYAAVVGLTWWGLTLVAHTSWTWLNELLAAAGGIAAAGLGALFYPGLVTVLIGLFAEPLCRSVEIRHYPERGPGREQPISEILVGTVNFAAKTIALNILVLPLYLLLPGLNIFVFAALNGYLVSVEYFEMVAARRFDLKQAKALRKQNFARLWVAGSVFALSMAVPVVSIVAPVVATVYMVHVLESLTAFPANSKNATPSSV